MLFRSLKRMLVDTDVLIWHMRGYPQATRRLDQTERNRQKSGHVMQALS